MAESDRAEVAELIYASINAWYLQHGRSAIFRGGPMVADVFYEVYNDLSPGCNVVAVNPENGRLMGACFYHPRESHVSLGIMAVHPNYFGNGVGGKLLRHIIEYTDSHGYPALRLTQSAINIDSFSLYNKAGFVPRHSYQDMSIAVPAEGLSFRTPGLERVRDASLHDVPAMMAIEREVSGITREPDYRYCIKNSRGYWNVSVIEDAKGRGLEGFLISSAHQAVNMLGPGVARTEEASASLILRELDRYRGRAPVFLIPMEKEQLVRQMYAWGARNCEMHFCQVRGEFSTFRGVNMPSFLPESA
jgi:GNAT superfamily N-acetyltransferase